MPPPLPRAAAFQCPPSAILVHTQTSVRRFTCESFNHALLSPHANKRSLICMGLPPPVSTPQRLSRSARVRRAQFCCVEHSIANVPSHLSLFLDTPPLLVARCLLPTCIFNHCILAPHIFFALAILFFLLNFYVFSHHLEQQLLTTTMETHSLSFFSESAKHFHFPTHDVKVFNVEWRLQT